MKKTFDLKLGRYGLTGLALAVGVFIADQATKWLVMEKILRVTSDGGYDKLALFPGLNFVMVWNRGVSFGMFGDVGSAMAFCALSILICIPLSVWMAVAEKKIVALSLALIIGGALGNVIDRIRFGAVADFIDVYAGQWHWPAFNIADSAIVIGAVLLIIDSILDKGEKA